ncbi:hypothetical protein OWR29_25510 [Actinoplanes sp. Pm04-4]|uniref:Uncharacterized protein n=1 Tax=Paractinoplanes pyxinae TaxID=2997416 RepID=A0ABT4B6A5_9ACTN|nr:hypothetical protein [Actinoplanes pyxinae]MCY1141370.1 hypothetical protein [Actinoplanes pyxinae]
MIHVEINADGRQVVIQAPDSHPIAKVLGSALRTWKATATEAKTERPAIEAGGMGFQIERADGPIYRDDLPGIARD